jgi:hypothetical protein
MMNMSSSELVKQYKTTEYDCRSAINKAGTVCSQCGGALTPIETVDNSGDPTFWSGCESCQQFDYGVKPIIHAIAKELVKNRGYVHYSHMERWDLKPKDGDEGYKKYWFDSQIGGATSIVRDVFQAHKKLTELL